MVQCECGSEMEAKYSFEQIKEIMGEESNPVRELNLKTLVVCPQCGIERTMTKTEIFKEFLKFRMGKGKSAEEVIEEVKEKKKELEG